MREFRTPHGCCRRIRDVSYSDGKIFQYSKRLHVGCDMSRIEVYLVPDLTTADALEGRTVAVIDVLRATTTIVHALAAGAESVLTCAETDDARAAAAQLGDRAVLGGERGGLRIPGFDLGNSPAEYTPQSVGDKTVVFTTTNGTRALHRARLGERVLVAAFVNFSAVCSALADAEQISLLCAGIKGEVTREDVLLAGAIVDDLQQGGAAESELNDQARLATDAWRAVVDFFAQGGSLMQVLKSSQGGRSVLDIGHEADIELAAQLDRFDLLPEWHRDSGRIRVARSE